MKASHVDTSERQALQVSFAIASHKYRQNARQELSGYLDNLCGFAVSWHGL